MQTFLKIRLKATFIFSVHFAGQCAVHLCSSSRLASKSLNVYSPTRVYTSRADQRDLLSALSKFPFSLPSLPFSLSFSFPLLFPFLFPFLFYSFRGSTGKSQSVSLTHLLARRIGPLGHTRLAASPPDRHECRKSVSELVPRRGPCGRHVGFIEPGEQTTTNRADVKSACGTRRARTQHTIRTRSVNSLL